MTVTILKFVHHCVLRLEQRQVLALSSDGSIRDRKFESLIWPLVACLLRKTEIKHRLSMKKRDWSWPFSFYVRPITLQAEMNQLWKTMAQSIQKKKIKKKCLSNKVTRQQPLR